MSSDDRLEARRMTLCRVAAGPRRSADNVGGRSRQEKSTALPFTRAVDRRQASGCRLGGMLYCRRADAKVAVTIKGQSAHNHVCGCTSAARRRTESQVAVVPGAMSVSANAQAKAGALTRRSSATHAPVAVCACTAASKQEPSAVRPDFIHTELSQQQGWSPPNSRRSSRRSSSRAPTGEWCGLVRLRDFTWNPHCLSPG